MKSHSDYIAALDGFTEIPGGWINHNYIQLGYQIADCVAGFSYSFVLTCIILFVLNLIPGLSLRISAEHEELGVDDDQLGEFAYDYVGIESELLPQPEYIENATNGNREPQHTGTAPSSHDSEPEKEPQPATSIAAV